MSILHDLHEMFHGLKRETDIARVEDKEKHEKLIEKGANALIAISGIIRHNALYTECALQDFAMSTMGSGWFSALSATKERLERADVLKNYMYAHDNMANREQSIISQIDELNDICKELKLPPINKDVPDAMLFASQMAREIADYGRAVSRDKELKESDFAMLFEKANIINEAIEQEETIFDAKRKGLLPQDYKRGSFGENSVNKLREEECLVRRSPGANLFAEERKDLELKIVILSVFDKKEMCKKDVMLNALYSKDREVYFVTEDEYNHKVGNAYVPTCMTVTYTEYKKREGDIKNFKRKMSEYRDKYDLCADGNHTKETFRNAIDLAIADGVHPEILKMHIEQRCNMGIRHERAVEIWNDGIEYIDANYILDREEKREGDAVNIDNLDITVYDDR